MDHSFDHLASRQFLQDGDSCDDYLHDHDARPGKILDNIIVGYAFGPKKMETMGLIMAEASKALSTFECAGTLSSMINRRQLNHVPIQQQQQQQQNCDAMELFEESSMATMTTTAGASTLTSAATGESGDDIEKESAARTHYFSDNDDTRSMSSTYTRSSFVSHKSHQKGSGGNMNGIQLTFMPDSSGFVHLVRTASSGGGGAGCEGESVTGSSSVTTLATSLASSRKQGGCSASCTSAPVSLSSSLSKDTSDHPPVNSSGLGSTLRQGQPSTRRSNASGYSAGARRRHPIRVSFVPIDLDTPLEEQHGGKFDVILHKMTEDILCMSKMLRARCQSSGNLDEEKCENDDSLETAHKMLGSEEGMQLATNAALANPAEVLDNPFESTPSMTRHQARASRRIQRLREYKQTVHPSCVLVDSPNNILAVMSRADMAEVLSRCLAGVTTKGGIPVRTPRFRVVDEDALLSEGDAMRGTTLADEIDDSGFEYPLIAKPLTAAGTKSSHHMGIVLARDGLQRLKTPCLLQEYANHGEMLFKVYVLGESVWVFSRESLPNLPMGEKPVDDDDDDGARSTGQVKPSMEREARSWLPKKRPRTESYVEFERPAGSRCYVEFNSQRPYPKLSDFGIVAEDTAAETSSSQVVGDAPSRQESTPRSIKQRLDGLMGTPHRDKEHQQLPTPTKKGSFYSSTIGGAELEQYVTKDEIEPVTNALRGAFGLELFGFDVLVKHNQNCPAVSGREVLVVDVNYFPGYKEVPNFPSLLAQYLTQKAVESRVRNYDVNDG